MNTVGAIILTVSAASMGIIKAFEHREQITEIKNIMLMLSLIKNEISSSLSPMNKILGKIKEEFKGEVQEFANTLFSSMGNLSETEFPILWQNAVNSCFNHLPENCMSALLSLGTSLGRYGAEAQISEITKCEELFARKLSELEPQCAKNQKAYIGLYSGIGLIIAIILI